MAWNIIYPTIYPNDIFGGVFDHMPSAALENKADLFFSSSVCIVLLLQLQKAKLPDTAQYSL